MNFWKSVTEHGTKVLVVANIIGLIFGAFVVMGMLSPQQRIERVENAITIEQDTRAKVDGELATRITMGDDEREELRRLVDAGLRLDCLRQPQLAKYAGLPCEELLRGITPRK